VEEQWFNLLPGPYAHLSGERGAFRAYRSENEAIDALSDALVAWGRKLAAGAGAEAEVV
jgi:hypothetical protein